MPIFRKHRRRNGNGSNNHHTEQQIGLALLGSTSAFSVWSAINPSFFTIRSFSTPESEKNVRFGMKLGLVLDVFLGLGLALAYGKKGLAPGILTALTGIGLYAAYEYTLKHTHEYNPNGLTMKSQG